MASSSAVDMSACFHNWVMHSKDNVVSKELCVLRFLKDIVTLQPLNELYIILLYKNSSHWDAVTRLKVLLVEMVLMSQVTWNQIG